MILKKGNVAVITRMKIRNVAIMKQVMSIVVALIVMKTKLKKNLAAVIMM